MSTLKVHDKEFVPYITSAQIEEQVTRVAGEINKDYAGKNPLFIAILNGAFIFAADLFKKINIQKMLFMLVLD